MAGRGKERASTCEGAMDFASIQPYDAFICITRAGNKERANQGRMAVRASMCHGGEGASIGVGTSVRANKGRAEDGMAERASTCNGAIDLACLPPYEGSSSTTT